MLMKLVKGKVEVFNHKKKKKLGECDSIHKAILYLIRR